MNVDDIIEELKKIRETYGNAPCYLIGDFVASDTLDYIKVYGANKVVFFNKKNSWTRSSKTSVEHSPNMSKKQCNDYDMNNTGTAKKYGTINGAIAKQIFEDNDCNDYEEEVE